MGSFPRNDHFDPRKVKRDVTFSKGSPMVVNIEMLFSIIVGYRVKIFFGQVFEVCIDQTVWL